MRAACRVLEPRPTNVVMKLIWLGWLVICSYFFHNYHDYHLWLWELHLPNSPFCRVALLPIRLVVSLPPAFLFIRLTKCCSVHFSRHK
jgi:hypothetical protein